MRPEALESWLLEPDRRPLLMGVLNVTPDSFSDGGRHFDRAAAVARAAEMVRQGASLIDVGGESTRPGSLPVATAEQIDRVVPVIAAIRDLDATVSIDTADATVAAAALDAGAAVVNDVTAGRGDPRMFALAAERACPIVLMHMLGTPRTMQRDPAYADVIEEVRTFLLDRAAEAERGGVARHRILLDVGIGFGKSTGHNLRLLKRHARIADAGYAMLLGTSRKAFLGKLTGVEVAAERLMGTAATVAWGVANGASVLRVHDVSEMRQVLDVIEAIRRA